MSVFTDAPDERPLDVALDLAGRGWPVLPLHEPTSYGPPTGDDRARCSCQRDDCRSQGKHPRTIHGLADATTDADVIRGWWERWPTANVGLATGTAFDALDLDGPAALAAIAAAGSDADPMVGPMVATGRGWHVYIEAGGTKNRAAVLPGVDWRGIGGYVVAPPSIHATGTPYRWEDQLGPDTPLEPPRPWLASILKTPARKVTTAPVAVPRATPSGDGTAYGLAALDGELGRLAVAADGARNDTLNRAAFALGQLVAGGQLDEHRATSELATVAERIGLGGHEVDATIRSGMDSGSAHPRAPEPPTRAGAAPNAPPGVDTTTGEITSPNLPDDLWTARPELAHVRIAAHCRGRSADAVLGAVLARVAALTPPSVRLPAPVGSAGTLDVVIGLIGRSGAGKSSSARTAAELVPIDDPAVRVVPVGSGEGLVEAYLGMVLENGDDGKNRKVKRQVARAVLAELDEGQALGELGSRKGSTLMPTIRSAWSGDRLGQANASEDTNRQLAPGAYRFAMLAGFQLEHAVALLDDAAGGTPQRFVFLSATDPTIPEVAPPWPGALGYELVRHSADPMTLDANISATIRAASVAVSRGEREVDPLDAHRDLVRLKVAGLLALMASRLHIDAEDWQLAGMVLDTSDRVRSAIQWTARQKARDAEAAGTARHVRRSAEVERSAEDRARDLMAASIARHVHKDGCDGGCRRRCVTQATASKHRQLATVDDAMDEAVGRGWIIRDGDTIARGETRPA